MMDPHDDCAAATEILDQVKLPQRVIGIERTARETADKSLQLARRADEILGVNTPDDLRRVEAVMAARKVDIS